MSNSKAKFYFWDVIPNPWTGPEIPKVIERKNNFSWPIACGVLFIIGVLGGFSFTSAGYVQEIYSGQVSTPQGIFRTEKVGP